MNIVAGITGTLIVAFGATFLLNPLVADSKWGVPVLVGAILLGILLIIYLQRKRTTSERITPQSVPVVTPPAQVPTQFPPPAQFPAAQFPAAQFPAAQFPPAQFPPAQFPPAQFPPAQVPAQTPGVVQHGFSEIPTQTMEFTSQDEFLRWIAEQNQVPDTQIIPQVIPEPRRRPARQRPQVTPQVTPQTPQPAQVTPQQVTPQPPKATLPSGSTGSALTPAEAQQMLDAHNKRRAKYGTPPLVWDAEIARGAQEWSQYRADTGKRGEHARGTGLGENLSWASGMDQTPEDVLVGWVDEEAPYYDYASNSCVGGVCLHMTQAIWKDSKKLGCGKVKKGKEIYWTCRYHEPGNFNMSRGNRPY